MPPKKAINEKDIVNAALEIIKTEGEDKLNARALSKKLGTSTQPIFSNFASMEELKSAVRERAAEMYAERIKAEISSGKYPPYKCSGMAYINFAREEAELFRMLFMRDRSREDTEKTDELSPIIDIIAKNVGISHRDAILFNLEMWAAVHGIAAMTVTSYLTLDEATVSGILTDIYQGLIYRFKNREDEK